MERFLKPSSVPHCLLERMKQGMVCDRFPSYHLNSLPPGKGRVRRDLEERHGEQLEISGKL